MARPLNVAVIGAGIAGLSVATHLAHRGIAARIFDKGRGAGGRTSTRRAGALEFDHGAPLFDARSPEFLAELERHERAGSVARWTPRRTTFRAGEHTAEPARDAWVGAPRMNTLAKSLASPLDVRLGIRIAEITRREGAWTLTSEAGESFTPFDAVIVTAPAPQAEAIFASAGSTALARAASGVEIGPCVTLMAGTEPVATDFDIASIDGGPLAKITVNAAKPQRPDATTWVLHAAGPWSLENFERADDDLRDALLACAACLVPNLPPPLHTAVHRWRYANVSRPLTAPIADDDTLLFGCGDWTHPATGVEGAWLSGRLAAEHLASCSAF